MRNFKIEPRNILGETTECAVFEDGTLRLVHESSKYGKYISIPNWKNKKGGFNGIHDIYNSIAEDEADIACDVNIAGKEETWVIRLLDRELGEKLRREQLEKFDNPDFGWGIEVEEDDIKYAIGLYGERLDEDDELALCFKTEFEAEKHITSLRKSGVFGKSTVIPVQCIAPKQKEMLQKEYVDRAKNLAEKLSCEATGIVYSFLELDKGNSFYNSFNKWGLGSLKISQKKMLIEEHRIAVEKVNKIREYMI